MLCLQGTHFRFKDRNRLRARGWKMISYANNNQKTWGAYTNNGQIN